MKPLYLKTRAQPSDSGIRTLPGASGFELEFHCRFRRGWTWQNGKT